MHVDTSAAPLRRRGVRLSRAATAQSVHFGWNSGAGLIADLAFFAFLVSSGASGARANVASSSIAITITYFLVTRFSFRVVPTWRTYGVFVAWYATSAGLVSVAIGLIGHGDESLSIIAKLCSVPVTFGTNFLFGRWVFTGGAERLLARTGGKPPGVVVRVGAIARRHRDAIIAAGSAVWFCVLILPLNERLAFVQPDSADSVPRRSTSMILLAIAIWGLALFVIQFARNVRAGSRRHRSWLLVSGSVLAVNAGVFLLLYPGLWVWDEFGVLSTVRAYGSYAWQGYLTNVFYTLSLFLMPSGVGVVIIQMVFGAIVAGYAVSTLATSIIRPWLVLLCGIPLLSFATLLNNEYPLRLTSYAYLLVLVLTRLLVAWRAERPITPAAFAGFGVAIALLAFWRSEGVVLLALLPVYFAAGSYQLHWRSERVSAGIGVPVGIVAITLSGAATTSASDPGYQVPAYVNPLSTMLQHHLTSPNLRADLAAIDRVIPIEALRANPSYLEAPAYYSPGPRPGYETALPGIRNAYVDLVVHNPGWFLANRVHAFIATNSMQRDYLPQIHNAAVFDADPAGAAAFQNFINTDPVALPIDGALRGDAIRVLLLTGTPTSSTTASVVWNAAPVLLALVGVLIWALVRRRAMWAVCAGAVLAHATLVFLTAPAAFFMYYFPTYLAGGLLVIALVAAGLDGLLTQRAAARADALAVELVRSLELTHA